MALKDYLGIAGDFLSSGLSTIGGFIANRQNAKENEKNRQWNEKMWNLANQYNLPQNQMSRLKAAGLNPNLVYGEGTSTLASYAGNLGTQKPSENPISNVHLNGADVVRLENETKVADSTAYQQNTAAAKNISDSNLADTQRIKLVNENQFFLDNYETQLQTNLQNLDILKKQGLIKEEEYKEQKNKVLKSLEDVRKAKEEANKAAEEVKTQEAMTANVKQSTITLGAQEEAFRAAAKLSSAEAVKALEQAKTEGVMRGKLTTDSLLNEANIKYLRKMGAKTDAEAKKCIIDAYNAIQNGEVERFIKTGPQRFGTSTLGAAVGILLDEFGMNPRTKTTGGYIMKNIKPIFSPVLDNVKKEVKRRNRRGHVGRH